MTTNMNSTAAYAAPYPGLEKRFVSSVLLAMLFIVIGMAFITALMGEGGAVFNASGLLVLVGPMAMFFLAWLGAGESTRKTSKPARDDRLTSSRTRPSESKSTEYFPAWLGRQSQLA